MEDQENLDLTDDSGMDVYEYISFGVGADEDITYTERGAENDSIGFDKGRIAKD